ncbi:MAG: hypothetical protein RIC19_10670 [Phaeodactylibacter sp.]|uniref:hypothetical protein n=1 Tax=Phaeodactylibacter sp. TaxID=1940289 RepID=UPI0032EE0553
MPRKFTFSILTVLLASFWSCESLDNAPQLTPDGQQVISKGADLQEALRRGYATWWGSIHSPEPAVALGVTADAYALPWDDFGAAAMGQEPRLSYRNLNSEPLGYRAIVEVPWYGCLQAVADANDVLSALSQGVSIDQNGPQDQSVRAAAYALRGLSWGYLSLWFDQAPVVDENTKLGAPIDFMPYPAVNARAIEELEAAIQLGEANGIDFIHNYFNGLPLDGTTFAELAHSYTARFLAQAARTLDENETIDWTAVLTHAEQGLSYDFAPNANDVQWKSYQQYTLADTEAGPFWARLDQRLVAAFDPNQPARYPQVEANGDAPLSETQATSGDARLTSDFVYSPVVGFPAERGEWHFSHYRHSRQVSQPGLFGNGRTGPMPTFLKADNDLLKAEALLRTGQTAAAASVIDAGSRTVRGNLPPLTAAASYFAVEEALLYERAIELFNTAPGNLWLDRRRMRPREGSETVTALGGLQWGTPAQLPVPASELRINGMEEYSFGGEQDPQGTEQFFY